jgi:hypothetical protein
MDRCHERRPLELGPYPLISLCHNNVDRDAPGSDAKDVIKGSPIRPTDKYLVFLIKERPGATFESIAYSRCNMQVRGDYWYGRVGVLVQQLTPSLLQLFGASEPVAICQCMRASTML